MGKEQEEEKLAATKTQRDPHVTAGTASPHSGKAVVGQWSGVSVMASHSQKERNGTTDITDIWLSSWSYHSTKKRGKSPSEQ